MGLGHFGHAVSAMPFQRCRFGDTGSAMGCFGDGTFRRWRSQMKSVFECKNMKNVFLKYALHEHLVARNTSPRKLSRYRMCDESMVRMVQRYASCVVTEYLRGIAHNF